MKGWRKDKKQVFCVILGSVIVLVSAWFWMVSRSERPVHVRQVIDGETLTLSDGRIVKLLGVNTAAGGVENNELAKEYLMVLLKDKNLWVENGLSGRNQVWLWVGCENVPKLLAVRATEENPAGCKKGVLVNEQIIKMGWSKAYFPENAVKVRYEERLEAL